MAAIAQHIANYDILHEIGRGGMAVVYQAYDRVNRRVIALKVLPAYLAHDPDLLRRFLREGQESVALQHPNIVRTYEAGEAEGVHYIAMEYLPGGSVAEALARQDHPFDLATTTSIAGQIASALDYAHDRGMLHRDVKLRNILLDGRGRAVLSDFGIAKVASYSTLTPARALIGSVHIMSPEQARGQPNLDRRSDVYELGVVLYEMLTGQPPFQGDHDAVIVHKILYEAPPPPRSLNSAIPPAVERVILTAMQKDRNKRYQTAGQLAAALQATMPAPTVTRTREPDTRVATPPRADTPPPLTTRPGTSIWSYVLGGAGIVVALLIVLALLWPRTPMVTRTPSWTTTPTTTLTATPMLPEPATAVSSPAIPRQTIEPTYEPRYHIIQRGETLREIADKYSVDFEDIVVANGLADANHIFQGQRLLIPMPTSMWTVAPTATPTITPSATPTWTPTTSATPIASSTAIPHRSTAAPTVTPLAAQLPPPILTGPDDGWSNPIGSVTFTWNPVPDVTGYIVETRSDRPGQTEWYPWSVDGGTLSLQLNYDSNSSYFQIPGTVYTWRVVPLGRNGQRGQPSTERRFVFQQPSLPPDTPEPPPTNTPVPPTNTPEPPPPDTPEPLPTDTPVPPTNTPEPPPTNTPVP